jgi:glycerophosphoryl diester phosphodiesterase
MKKKLRYLVLAVLVFATFAWVNNTDLFMDVADEHRPLLLAHRGLAQTFTREGLTNETCTATRIFEPEHRFLENTLPSMAAAFAAGADIVELDIHPTTDGEFAVFHDWTLDCRTEGKGVTREHAMADLKRLDVGYGYTADDGHTFPFRGRGVGMMPTLEETLNAFPDESFLINVKSNDASEGDMLASFLARLPAERRARVMVYGGTPPVERVRQKLPDVPIGSQKSIKRCLISYALVGWSGRVPDSCRKGIMLVPLNIAPWMWGWPHKFMRRMHKAGVRVFVLGPYDGSSGTPGVDDLSQFARLPKGYSGGVWTNRIDRIGAAVRGGRLAP